MNKQTLFKRLKRLKQNLNKSEEEIWQQVNRNLAEKELVKSFSGLMDDEVKKATKLYYKYVDEHSFESIAERSTLINLVYKEILKERMQDFIKKENEEKKGAIPLQMVSQMMELDAQILTDKKGLGMLSGGSGASIYQLWKDLETKCLKYYEEHAAEFQNKCPYCNKLFPSILPPEKLEPQKSSWFKGTDLYNEEVFNLYHNKTITEEEAAKILGVSKFYVPYIYKEVYLKEKNDSQTKQ